MTVSDPSDFATNSLPEFDETNELPLASRASFAFAAIAPAVSPAATATLIPATTIVPAAEDAEKVIFCCSLLVICKANGSPPLI